jgi:chorismate synthase
MGIKIRIEYLDGRVFKDEDGLPYILCPMEDNNVTSSVPSTVPSRSYVTLLYRPGHYDILYVWTFKCKNGLPYILGSIEDDSDSKEGTKGVIGYGSYLELLYRPGHDDILYVWTFQYKEGLPYVFL